MNLIKDFNKPLKIVRVAVRKFDYLTTRKTSNAIRSVLIKLRRQLDKEVFKSNYSESNIDDPKLFKNMHIIPSEDNSPYFLRSSEDDDMNCGVNDTAMDILQVMLKIKFAPSGLFEGLYVDSSAQSTVIRNYQTDLYSNFSIVKVKRFTSKKYMSLDIFPIYAAVRYLFACQQISNYLLSFMPKLF